jgi:hypothetical protein
MSGAPVSMVASTVAASAEASGDVRGDALSSPLLEHAKGEMTEAQTANAPAKR